MKILVVGATGMLGQTLAVRAELAGYRVFRASRNSEEIPLDITCDDDIRRALNDCSPDILINAAAMTNIALCESQPEMAELINGDAVCKLASACRDRGIYFVQISTDHYFSGDVDMLHDEESHVHLHNVYAKTKYAGEHCATKAGNYLVVRTNITGFRGDRSRPTFAEWALQAIRHEEVVIGYDNYYTSTIDVVSFSDALLDLLANGISGVINLASSEVSSKYQILKELSNNLTDSRAKIEIGTVNDGEVKRALSLGLNVSKAESILGYRLPGRKEVVERIIRQEKGL